MIYCIHLDLVQGTKNFLSLIFFKVYTNKNIVKLIFKNNLNLLSLNTYYEMDNDNNVDYFGYYQEDHFFLFHNNLSKT